jgi:small subunit ribosomal protein S8
MSLIDPLANAMSHMLNCEKKSKMSCTVKNVSTLIKSVLTILKEKDYIEDFKSTETTRGEVLEITLKGGINKCGVIKPRFAVKKGNFEKFEKRYLPARDFGIIIVSTPKGVITHDEAIKNNTGGRLIAYCY